MVRGPGKRVAETESRPLSLGRCPVERSVRLHTRGKVDDIRRSNHAIEIDGSTGDQIVVVNQAEARLFLNRFTRGVVWRTSSFTSASAFGAAVIAPKIPRSTPGAGSNVAIIPGDVALSTFSRKYRAVTGGKDAVSWATRVEAKSATAWKVCPTSLDSKRNAK